jgi:membrane fusion protein, multidrug efflux system
MKRLLIAAITATTILTFSCSSGRQDSTSQESSTRVEPVRVVKLDYQIISRTVEFTSTLQAYEEIHMAPASPGRIENIYVDVGSRVSKRDVIAQMDRTQLHQAEIQLRTLEADFIRLDTLQKAGSIPQQQYDQFKAQLEIAHANVAFLRDNTRIHAPFNAVVSGKYFESGEMFTGAPNTPVGKAAIVSLIQIDRLKAAVPVSERYFPMIKTGMEARVVSDIYPGRTFTGKIFRIHPTIDALSRSFNVEIVIENREGILRPGMFIRVAFEIDQVQAIVLPAIAVLKLQGSNDRYLFVEKNGVARRVAVLVGTRYDDDVEVISDELKQGDNIIISGQARLIDGIAVEVVK